MSALRLVTPRRGCERARASGFRLLTFGAQPYSGSSFHSLSLKTFKLSRHVRYMTIPPKISLDLTATQEEFMASAYRLPEGYLEGPAPNLTRKDVDFEKAGLVQQKNAWAVILDGVMTQEECGELIAAAEATTAGKWERALVNIGGGRQAMYEDTRKCGRIIWDDREVMAKLWGRIGESVPEIHRLENWPTVTGSGPMRRKEVWKVTRLNERQRFLKYTGGEYFKSHCDGTYETPDGKERSHFTLHLYLNDEIDKDGKQQLKGGATTFYNWNMDKRIDVVPKVGRVLLFQHRDLLHSGDDVVKGTKYTMRTDVLYEREEQPIVI